MTSPRIEKESAFHKIYINWLVIIVSILVDAEALHLYKTQWGDNPITISGLITLNSIMILIVIISTCFFYIDSKYMIISYGLGIFRKKVSITDISSVEIIENKFRFSPKKANIKDWHSYYVFTLTKKCLLIRIKGNRLGLMIGLPDNSGLKDEIERHLTNNSST